jgi:hypothetical protein
MKRPLFLALLLFSSTVLSDAIKSIPTLSNSQVKIDGVIKKGEWSGAIELELNTETWPAENEPTPKEYHTKVLMFNDADSLNIAVIASDPNPSDIKATYYRRDYMSNNDFISIKIDPFAQAQEAYVFSINPLGGQSDYITLGRSSVSWDGLWTSKGKITATGFQLEIRIPFSNFRFSDSQSQQWAIDISRNHTRERNYTYNSRKNDRGNDCQLCKYSKYNLSNIKPSSNVQFRGYVKASNTNSKDYPYNDGFNSDDDLDAGLDVKYAPNANQVINAVYNPDFSQVEADDFQYEANTNFSVYYAERRTFFLEGNSYFSSPMNLVHTRILSDPDYGAKYTGKEGNHTFGAFYVKDDETNIITPGLFGNDLVSIEESSNNAAFRYKYQFDNSSHLGASMTSRNSNNYSNNIISIDGFYRVNNQARVSLQYAQSDNELFDAKTNGNALALAYNYNDARDWHWLRYKRYDTDFNAGMSFITQNGFEEYNTGAGYLWNFDKGFFTRSYITYSYTGKNALDDSDSNPKNLLKSHEFETVVQGRNNFELRARYRNADEFYSTDMFDTYNILIFAQYEPIKDYTFSGWSYNGKAIDYWHAREAELDEYGFNLVANVTPELSLDFLRKQRDVEADSINLYQTTIDRITLNYSLNFQHHFRLKAQLSQNIFNMDNFAFNISSKSNQAGYQLLYVYQPSSYTTLYAGYSSNFREDDQIGKLAEFNNYAFIKFNLSWGL